MNNNHNSHNIHHFEQSGGKVVTSKVFYADTPQNRKLKRVGKLYKYKHRRWRRGKQPRVWYTLVKKKSPKNCPPNKEMSPKGNCVLKKCPSGKKLTLKGKCINKAKKSKRSPKRKSSPDRSTGPRRMRWGMFALPPGACWKSSPKRKSSRTKGNR